jgi:tRNA G26 N,N-dimethylase Trm1
MNAIPSTFSSLNNDVIPDDKFLENVQKYKPKLSVDIIKQICQEKGLISSDPRVYKIISIVAQEFLEDILKNTADSINSNKKTNKFMEYKELIEVLKEKGIETNRTQFFCDNLNVNLDKQSK